MTTEELRERLANEAHKAWSGWMECLFSKCSINADGTMRIPLWAVDRWSRQIETEYEDLPEDEKESDRREADRYLAAMLAAREENQVGTKSDHGTDPVLSDTEAKTEVCRWEVEGGYWWYSMCHPVFVEIDPETSDMHYWRCCPFCSRPIEIVSEEVEDPCKDYQD